jgi:hypothetical protein
MSGPAAAESPTSSTAAAAWSRAVARRPGRRPRPDENVTWNAHRDPEGDLDRA